MSTVPFIPDTAPFTPEQRAWLNGFFAGMFSRAPVVGVVPSPREATTPLTPLTILFGSQTGTAEGLAKRVAKEAGKRHFAATILDMAQCDLAKLAGEKNLLVLTSTYGDGEPPDSAKALHTALASASLNSQPSTLNSVRFSVLALGDTNYTQFCKAGADFDLYIEKLGARRVTPRADCDLDYEEKFTAWLNTALSALGSASPSPLLPVAEIVNRKSEILNESGFSRSRPFPALLLTSRNLSGASSAKQINHIEFDLTGSGLAYEAGDALGVVPHNCPTLVVDVLAALGCDGEEAVPAPDGSSVPLRRALTELYDLGKPSPDLLSLFALVPAGDAAPSPRLSAPHHVIDVLLESKIENPKSKILSPTDFVRALKKIQPRLYSISSSPRAHANQVHLTVGAVRYDLAGRARKGVCSTFLADRTVTGETRVGVFVHSNKAFRPPASGDTPMIMVGPGTGIAPFRAFLEERRATGAKGKNWLFFGDQRAATDFIYRDELLGMQADGTLTRLDLAWSRDQQEKIYVQNRMTEHAAELFAWLEQGAHFYVCGDASRMAKDVDAALHTGIERAGKKSADEAAAYVQGLKAAKRYARDVY
ncbi:MAG: Sulfite reductase flavoprotein alpha-component [Verrucomicrobiota bacterium]|jgi:sulfite reductase (NADPH) flavoprotein alpha-component